MELRKIKEIELHNRLRAEELKVNKDLYKYYASNSKFYSIDRGNKNYVYNWLKQNCQDKIVLDYGCGDGRYTFLCAEYGACAVGIDISNITIEVCKRTAIEKGLDKYTSFFMMDAEELTFDDDYFDIIICMGVLHHLDLKRALGELSRVLKPDGRVICTEALGHNPLIQLYRRMTPHMRTEYEADHIIKMSDLELVHQFFNKIETRFFHILTLLAVPFRNRLFFSGLLSVLEKLDNLLLRIPVIQFQAWMVVFELSEPKKE